MILVTGGTGLVGSRLVSLLLANQQAVRILVRGYSDWKDSSMPQFRRTGVDIITGDVRDQKTLSEAAEGCQAIINLAGIFRSDGRATVESVNSEALVNVVAVAESHGIQRLIHVSCLGAIEHSGCRYLTSKWAGETIVKSFSRYWTIFRPGLIFGEGSHLEEIIQFWVRGAPFVPIIGSGLNLIRPISPDDVASCILQSLYNRDTASKTYELVGPKSYTLTELLQLAAADYGYAKAPPVIHLPANIGFFLVRLVSKLNPTSPLDEDVVKVMITDLDANPKLMQESFQVQMLPYDKTHKEIDFRN